MKKVKIKIPAKVNLTLDILGVKDGYHQLKSLVCSVSVYDTIILKKRKDKEISLLAFGLNIGTDEKSNNAYLAAKLFMEKLGTSGVDIKLIKRIPIGGGMGGSSADIVAVLLGMKKLFNLDCDLVPLANELGSDTAYMLNGGTKIISGRGEIITDTAIKTSLYFTALKCDESISAGKCYSVFDSLNKRIEPCTDLAVKALEKGDFLTFISLAKNDLYHATSSVVDKVDKNLAVLKEAGAPLTIMTGSGTVVLGVYKDKKIRDKNYKLLRKTKKDNLLKFDTVNI